MTGQHPGATGAGPGSDQATASDGGTPDAEQAYAARYGLVRPTADRQLAGVCSGIGWATGTDPVLWRVLFAVGVIFGGVGLVGYLLGWLVMPDEGDTGSPLEALFGHGRSRTSGAAAAVLAGVTAVLLVLTIQWTPFVLLAVAAGVWLLHRHRTGAPLLGTPTERAPEPPRQPEPPQRPGSARQPEPVRLPWPAPASEPAEPIGAPAPIGNEGPVATEASAEVASGWRGRTDLDGPGQEPAELGGQPVGVGGRKPADRVRSPLLRVALFAVLVALGAVAVADLTVVDVPPSGYLAAGVGVIGVALLVGAWLGRARGLIWLGATLTVALLVVGTLERVGGAQVWVPTAVDEVAREYLIELGDARLDLRGVDFTNREVTITVTVSTGNMVVLVPPDVDVTGEVVVSYGQAQILGDQAAGDRRVVRRFLDLGHDGVTGPGRITLHARVSTGNLAVTR